MNKPKILIVDDDKFVLRALTLRLNAEGYEVITAKDGAGAVSMVREHQPDLMLLDITFPPDIDFDGGVAWDGFLIMDWLRRLGTPKPTPVIIITGGDPTKFKARALAAGAAGFYQKSEDPESLVAQIRELLGGAAPAP
jgi:DNA-binding response OmpR family regulator